MNKGNINNQNNNNQIQREIINILANRIVNSLFSMSQNTNS